MVLMTTSTNSKKKAMPSVIFFGNSDHPTKHDQLKMTIINNFCLASEGKPGDRRNGLNLDD